MSLWTWLSGSSKSAAASRQQARQDKAIGVNAQQSPEDRFMESHRLEQDPADRFMESHKLQTIESEPYYDLVSSNVDRIRYCKPTRELQVVFKNGSAYQYENVEPDIVPVEVPAGGGAFHAGWTWHGSGDNPSPIPRRSLVAHCMPADVRLHGLP